MIDLTKPVQTRCGYKVEIYNVERRHGAYFWPGDKGWRAISWTEDWRYNGRYNSGEQSVFDLVNVPVKHEGWMAIWTCDETSCVTSCVYSSAERVKELCYPAGKPLAIIKVSFTEGEGLFALGAMDKSPCFCCGYSGPGYYDPVQHACAARHHKLMGKGV